MKAKPHKHLGEESLDMEWIANSPPSFVTSKKLPVASSTPKISRKCNKCPDKSKKIKKWRRRHGQLNKQFEKLNEKYAQLKNTQVKLATV